MPTLLILVLLAVVPSSIFWIRARVEGSRRANVRNAFAEELQSLPLDQAMKQKYFDRMSAALGQQASVEVIRLQGILTEARVRASAVKAASSEGEQA